MVDVAVRRTIQIIGQEDGLGEVNGVVGLMDAYFRVCIIADGDQGGVACADVRDVDRSNGVDGVQDGECRG